MKTKTLKRYSQTILIFYNRRITCFISERDADIKYSENGRYQTDTLVNQSNTRKAHINYMELL